jgi:hypothetical protein
LRLSNLAGLSGETLDLVNPLAGQLGETCVKTASRLSVNLATMKSEMDKNPRSPLTEPIRKANNDCDASLNEIKRTAKAGEQSTIPAKADAGKTLMFFLKPFWHLDKEPLVTQIGMTEELLRRYNSQQPLPTAAQILGMAELFPALEQQNMLLNELYNRRLDEHAALSPAAGHLHGDVTEDYEGLCGIVLKTVNLEPVPQPILDLFHKMDDLRKKYAALSPAHIDIRHAVTEPIDTHTYTGKAITPIPVARYEDVELTFAKDFNVTYRHNVEVGEATVILHGKGRFNGSHERKFNIVQSI